MIKKNLRRVFNRSIAALSAVIQPRDRVFVFGSPATEGNALIIAKTIGQESQLPITWVNAPSKNFIENQGFHTVDRVELIRSTKNIKSVWRYLTSKYIFTTTELYGMPTPKSNRIVVNVWHGEGIKSGKFFPDRTAVGPSSTYLVGSTQLLASSRAVSADVPAASVLLTGMPRIDLFKEPLSNQVLINLGINPTIPFILLMPTFRRAKRKSGKLWWTDTTENYTTEPFAQAFSEELGASLTKLGVQIVVKPHYLDFDKLPLGEFKTITDDSLLANSATLYGLMARSSALISDYSSVWLDYLHLDKPIAFFTPDSEDFWKHRDMDENFRNLQLPGLHVRNSNEIFKFCANISKGSDPSRKLRDKAKEELGLIGFESNTRELLRVLSLIE